MSDENRIEGTSSSEFLTGGIGADRIEGEGGNDTLIGGEGADRLDGDSGNDSLDGGVGADRIKGGNGADMLTGGNGADRFDFDANDSTAANLDFITDFESQDKINLSNLGVTSLNQVNVSFNSGITTVAVPGTSFQLALNGSHNLSASNFIFFGQSNDLSGNDSPGDWDDSFEDSLLGGMGDDSLTGDIYDDLIYGGGGVNAPSDNGDHIYGHRGHDRIYGNGGADVIFGDDSVNDDVGYDDSLYGGLGDDSLFGGAGDDEIFGHDGNDLLCSGKGDDSMTGGSGNDIFLILNNTGYNLILDFDDNGTDVMSIQRTATIRDFSDVQAHLISDANGSFIGTGNGQGITLAGVLAGELTADDFYFWG